MSEVRDTILKCWKWCDALYMDGKAREESKEELFGRFTRADTVVQDIDHDRIAYRGDTFCICGSDDPKDYSMFNKGNFNFFPTNTFGMSEGCFKTADALMPAVNEWIDKAAKSHDTLYITGHSRGGQAASALAFNLAMYSGQSNQLLKGKRLTQITFGAPPLGLKEIRELWDDVKKDAFAEIQAQFDGFRFVCGRDCVPRILTKTVAGHLMNATDLKPPRWLWGPFFRHPLNFMTGFVHHSRTAYWHNRTTCWR